jgi:murein DD-endopeptidase MepM/ murein hydrolase activator NlpD
MIDGATAAAARAASDGHPQRRALQQAIVGASGAVGQAEVSLDAVTEGPTGLADAVTTAHDVNLAGGRVVASRVHLAVQAHVRPDGAEVGVVGFEVAGLLVDGRAVDVVPGGRVELPGLGTLIMLEQVSDGAGSVRANGLRLEVSDPAGGLPVGSQVVIGHLEVAAASGVPPAPAPPPAPEAPSPRQPDGGAGFTPAPPRPPLPAPSLPRVRARALPPPVGIPRLPSVPTPLLPRRAAPDGVLPAETDGYVFPVYGQVSYGDDYGAPRAVTEWHHGNDLFATEGTPVLAVADGTLFNVGVNTLGGNRLWLRDGRGNTFYYAHLSAYAPVAAEGAQVRAGEVIGFVGHTGQAITTPPHLHFEIHPGDGDSVNPYPYLLAWQRRTDVALAFRAAAVAHGQAPAAGVLVIGYTPPSQQVAPDGEGLAEAAP